MVQEENTAFVAPQRVAGLAELAEGYDLILCDVWGVVHNGLTAFPAACDALSRARAGGASVILVSNAPRPSGFIVTMLDRLGVPRGAYDRIVTSGDVTRSVLAARPGVQIFHLGPPRDIGTFDGLDLVVGPLSAAELVVCTGLFDDETETPLDYAERLADMHARDLTFVCANPDLVVERGAKLVYCAGAIAKLYDEMGGRTHYCGKPHRPIYETALAEAAAVRGGPVGEGRVLCIGDALRTDIIGATAAGFDSLFIASGIHAEELNAQEGAEPSLEALANLFSGHAHPRGVMPRLAW
ncbi:TIGR01459 family HAD-type hydrolase [Aquabacter spiritensis]|uniref:HAD superfamily hydrolase (TIGR01459 family) n=1 Tax=Aquabacter spiritensis TaxID=933073 RepID=A0A4R3M5D8_9HYPH|nr:TIGR01459 family HAD-type hydrolase [Aquabacter spiritensis]TCT06657.1 HAD superfamily hydrolase (TIGR01459 family) [Aquabacter spiritensis]